MAELVQGYNTYVGMGIQSGSIGTQATPTVFQKSKGIKLNERHASQARIASNTGKRGYYASIKGRTTVDGSIPIDAYPDEWIDGLLFAMMLGSNNSVSGSAGIGYTHTFEEPVDCTDFPVYGSTISAYKGGCSLSTAMRFDYVGCFLKTLTIDIPEDGIVTVEPTFVASECIHGGTLPTATFSSKTPYETWMAKLEIGATISTLTPLAFTNFNFSADTGAEMRFSGGSAVAKVRTFNGFPDYKITFTADMADNLTLYDYWVNKTEVALRMTLTHTDLAGTSSGAYSIQIDLPRGIFTGQPFDIDGQALQKENMTFESMMHETLGYGIKVITVNSHSGTYAV